MRRRMGEGGGGIERGEESGEKTEKEERLRLKEEWYSRWRKGLRMRKERDGRRRNGFKWREEASMQELGKEKE
jgi:hypothetical protein